MNDNDTKRISRLTAILTLLQSKSLLTAKSLADKFGVSSRTIYRDIRALEQAGVPVITEEGKGFALMQGYYIPPVMFTEKEAMALITAEQFIAASKDTSLIDEFTSALTKIKSVLRYHTKEKTELLEHRIFVGKNFHRDNTSDILMSLQSAIAEQRTIYIHYTAEDGSQTSRTIEPYMLYHTDAENWTLLAFCRLRKDFRSFRIDRIQRHTVQNETFTPDEKGLNAYIEKNFLS